MFGIDLRRVLPPRGWRRTVALRRVLAAALVVLAAVLALAPRAAAPSGRVVVATRDLAAGVPLSPTDLAVRAVPADLVPAGALGDAAAGAGRLLVGGVRAGETLTDVRLLARPAAIAAARAPDAAGVPLRLADPAVAGLLTAGSRVDVVGVGARSGTVQAPRAGEVRRSTPSAARPGSPHPAGAGVGGAAAAGSGVGVGAGGGAGAGAGGGADGDADGDADADPSAPGVLAAGAVVLGVLPAVERTATGPVVVVALPGALAARVAAATLSQEVTVTLR